MGGLRLLRKRIDIDLLARMANGTVHNPEPAKRQKKQRHGSTYRANRERKSDLRDRRVEQDQRESDVIYTTPEDFREFRQELRQKNKAIEALIRKGDPTIKIPPFQRMPAEPIFVESKRYVPNGKRECARRLRHA